MNTVALIALKDLRQRLRDRSLLLFAIAVPLGLAVIFTLVLGNADSAEITRYAVVDRDGGEIAAAFVDRGLRPLEREKVIRLQIADSADTARRLAERGEVAAAFVIPPGFSAAVRSGRTASIQVIGNVDAPVGAQVAKSIAESFSAELHAVRLAVAVALRGPSTNAAQAAELAERAAQTAAPLTVQDVSAAKRELGLRTYFAASMAVFFLFFTVQFGVASILEERRDGTLARLLAAPVRRRSILWGKLFSSVAVGLVSMTVLVTASTLLLGASWGDPLGVALLVVAGVLAATGVMAVVATLARTAEQAGNWQAIIAVVLGMLGGSFFPVAQAQGVIASLSYITPHRWFLQGLADLAGGGTVAAVAVPVLAMLIFAVVTGGLATLRLGRMLRP